MGVRDWQAAQKHARDMEANGIDKCLTGGHGVLTVQKAIDDFKTDIETHLRPSTGKQYRIILARLSAFCDKHGYVFLRQLDVVQLREFRQSWRSYNPLTPSRHIDRLKRYVTFCVENKWTDESPAKSSKSPKIEETKVVPFSEEENHQGFQSRI
jgi:site-specific recombinase XerD